MLPKYWRECMVVVVETGFNGLSPTRSALSVFTRKSAKSRFEGVRFACVCSRLLPAQPLRVSWPLGRPVTTDWLYSESNVSENQARPRTMGPEKPTRGYQLFRRKP